MDVSSTSTRRSCLRPTSRRASRGDRRGLPRRPRGGPPPPARLGEQVGRGALRPRGPAHGPGRRSAHAAACTELARRSVERLAPYARELGCADALAEIERTISWGNGATRMMRAYNANRDMTELMRELAHATELRSGDALSASSLGAPGGRATAGNPATPATTVTARRRRPRGSPLRASGAAAVAHGRAGDAARCERVREIVAGLAAEREHKRAHLRGQRLAGVRPERAQHGSAGASASSRWCRIVTPSRSRRAR